MDALAEARKVIASRAEDPKAKMLGIADDLRAIGRALDELERRVGVLAAVALGRHYGQAMNESLWESLSQMSEHARDVHRIGVHPKNCTCRECCLHALVIFRPGVK